jgi:hypothetical protein
MMMVDTYNKLPQLKYAGKYPSSMVSPQEHTTLHQNGENKMDVVVVSKEEVSAENKVENGATTDDADTVKIVSPPKTRASAYDRTRPSISPKRDRGGSPRRGIDSYRPRSPDRYRSRSRGCRSQSRGRRLSSSNDIHRGDRYISPERRRRERDVYIPPRSPRSPRKRSYGDDSPRGREKRRRSSNSNDGDMSEGEVR